MKLHKDTCYINFHVHSDGSESAGMTHFKDIWENGYAIDTYDFSQNRMDFEDASWNGIDPNNSYEGKQVPKTLYNKWKCRVNDCKSEIERLANEKSSPLEEPWNNSEYLYFPLKELIDWSEEEFPDEGPVLCLVHVTNNNSDNPEGTTVSIDDYCTMYTPKPEPIIDFLGDFLDKPLCIPKEVFDYAANLIAKVSSEILEEIKTEFKQ